MNWARSSGHSRKRAEFQGVVGESVGLGMSAPILVSAAAVKRCGERNTTRSRIGLVTWITPIKPFLSLDYFLLSFLTLFS
jgi:hypothetical protein